MELDAKIESLLFFRGEPISVKRLAILLDERESAIKRALETLNHKLEGRGVVLVEKDNDVLLSTAPSMSTVVEQLSAEELEKTLSKAALETLTIVLYRGPVTRSQIDYIRGVNSSFILRALMIRGLIEKTSHPTDARSTLYRPTFKLLSFLGLKNQSDLPEYDTIQEEITSFEGREDIENE